VEEDVAPEEPEVLPRAEALLKLRVEPSSSKSPSLQEAGAEE